MGDYRQTIDRFALNALIKQPNIPDFHLMVGSAETLDGLPLLVYENANIPKAVVNSFQDMQGKTTEEIAEAIANNTLEVNDLNWNVALIGGGLGEV